MDRNTRVILGFLVFGAMAAVPYLSGALYVPPPPKPPAPIVEIPKEITDHVPIQEGDSMEEVLIRAGLDQPTRLEVLQAILEAYDVRKVRAGRDLLVTRMENTGEMTSLEYIIDPDHRLELFRSHGESAAEVVEIAGTVKEVPVCATLQDSLSATMDHAGESFKLAMMMADVLAYDIDFDREPQNGDDFCLLVEKKFYDNDQPPTLRRILGARYNNHGAVSDAYFFAGADSKGSFYSGKGESLKSSFLRSPLEFDARVSSHFSMNRLHPVLHTTRAHYGTDYAAPTGTPVRAVADGTVVGAGMSGGSGNMVTIRHTGGYQTQYLHLSRILVHQGQHIDQGTRLGLVGQTGLATGPHLDIRISKNGSYLNWEKMRAPRSVSLDGQMREAFLAERDRMLAAMNPAPAPAQVSSVGGAAPVGGN
ncbi:MAG: peptidoglycan DD-metalloendopeptidase family protein [Acidobacteriota bacterium]